MRQSRAAKAESRQRILTAASRLVRERGIERTSVADVMAAAGMTHGGFYKHFASKDAMIAAALAEAFDDIVAEMRRYSECDGPQAAVDAYVALSLSDGHRSNPGIGCPIVALGGEVSRVGGIVAQSFAAGIDRLIAAIAERLPGPAASTQERASRLLSGIVGAVVIARASESGRGDAVNIGKGVSATYKSDSAA